MSKNSELKQGFIRKWAPLFVMGLAIVIIVLDTTLLNVSLGTIVRDLKTNIQSLQWVITAYALTLSALTITGGRFGDLFGRKKMFMLGAIIFAIGSFIASISHSVGMLIIGESIIEGIGAALMMPATSSLLVSTYKGRERALALGIWGGMAAAGAAIGPVVGGWLTSHYSWRWGFRINIVVAAVLLLGSVLLHEARDREERPTIDWWGVLLSAGGLTAVVYALIESATYGWWAPKQPFAAFGLLLDRVSIVPVALALGIGLLALFFVWEQRMVAKSRTPLVSMKLFANRQFTVGALLTAILSVGMVGLIFGMPVFYQGVLGLDALHTGYGLLPMSAGVFITAPLGGILAKHFKPKHIVQVGFAVTVLALLFLRQTFAVTATVSDFIAPLLLFGVGMGLVFSQITNITLSAVSPSEAGEASGVNNTLRQVGQSLGTALIGTILIASIGNGLVDGVKNSTVIPDQHRAPLMKAVEEQASNIEFGIPLQGSLPSDAELAELKRIANASTVKANKDALLFTAAFFLGALALATQLPSVDLSRLEKNESLAVKSAH